MKQSGHFSVACYGIYRAWEQSWRTSTMWATSQNKYEPGLSQIWSRRAILSQWDVLPICNM